MAGGHLISNLISCHGLTTQRWRLMNDGVISNGVTCLDYTLLTVSKCIQADTWTYEDERLKMLRFGQTCLARHGNAVILQGCDSHNQVCDVQVAIAHFSLGTSVGNRVANAGDPCSWGITGAQVRFKGQCLPWSVGAWSLWQLG